MTIIRIFGLTALFATATVAQALAHASFVTSTAPAETTSVVALQIPHGCDGKPTTEVQIKLPEGFVFAKPQPKPGWDLEIIRGDYQKSYDDHGTKVTAGAVEIRWKNGSLPEEFYDTFVIQGKVSGAAAGTALAFPVTQLCGASDKVAWDEIAPAGTDSHALKHPAPVITVSDKPAHGHDHDAMAGMAGMAHDDMAMAPGATTAMAPVKAGDLELSAGFVKAMLPGQPVGGGFVTIHNGGSDDDRLLSVASAAAGSVELHEMAVTDGVMTMRKLDGIAIAAGETVTLSPGGLHLMFLKVATPFAEGASVPLTLTFEKAGAVDVVLPVTAIGKKS